jgi:dephospho-CoA kinase
LKVFGITGGIASGKSTAAGFFRELGVPVVDADEIARDLRAPGGAASATILIRFGTLDRVALREKIAADPKARKDLEAILHPLIRKESERRFAALASAGSGAPPYALYEAALLVEAGRASLFAGVILVESRPENQLERLIRRDGMPEASARQFLDATSKANPIERKRKSATHTIRNDGTLEGLRAEVARLHQTLVALVTPKRAHR